MAYDLLYVGGGAAIEGALRAASLGLKAAVVERERLGGTAVFRGGVPIAALMKSARLFRQARSFDQFGLLSARPVLDYERLRARRDEAIERASNAFRERLARSNVDVIYGSGTLEDESTVRVTGGEGEGRLTARAIVLATGSTVRRLSDLQPDGHTVLTTDDALQLRELPESICIIGGGPSGCEFASFFAALGSKVVLLEREPSLLPELDVDLGRELSAQFAGQGVIVFPNAAVESVRRTPEGRTVEFLVGNQRQTTTVEKVLLAAGRGPRSAKLGLDRIGVKLDTEEFIVIDENGRTSVENVYAVGDATPGPMLYHRAVHQARHIAERVAGKASAGFEVQFPLVVQSDPQVASVGLNEGQARERYGDATIVRRTPLRVNVRSFIEGEEKTFVKLIFDPQDRVVGAHMLGRRLGDAAGALALAVRTGQSAATLQSGIVPHLAATPFLDAFQDSE